VKNENGECGYSVWRGETCCVTVKMQQCGTDRKSEVLCPNTAIHEIIMSLVEMERSGRGRKKVGT
jgi:hypothetical protein